MRISIETPVFKGRWLPECVQSVLNQTSGDWVLSLLWDGGDELSRRYLEELQARSHPQIKVYFSENRGIAQARRFLSSCGEGDYILPVDDDDVLAPRAVERFLAFVRARPWCGIVRARRSFIDEAGKTVHEPPWFPFERRHYQRGMVMDLHNHCQPYLIARWAYERTAGWEGFPDFRNAGEDCDIFLKMEEVAPVELLDENLYHYRLNSNRHSLVLTADGAYEMWRRLADKTIARIGLPLERITERPPFHYRRVPEPALGPQDINVVLSGAADAGGPGHCERLRQELLASGVPASAIHVMPGERAGLWERNEALRQTSLPLVWLLDASIEMPVPSVLAELLAILHAQEADLISPRIVGPDNRIRCAEPYFEASGIPMSKGPGEVDAGQYGYLAEVSWLPSRALLIRRAVLKAVGAFDEGTANTTIADVDLCLRARLRDFKCLYAGTVVVRDHGPEPSMAGLEADPAWARLAEKWKNHPDLWSTRGQLDLVLNG